MSELLGIRDATIADADSICDVLRRSIAQLCIADHDGDDSRIGQWLENKTPHEIHRWIKAPSASILVGEFNEKIVIVGGVMDSGVITLNYVAPEARFHKFSSAMLTALEQRAKEKGATRLTLTSTKTARQFYRNRGYIDIEPASDSQIEMEKAI